eukprot:357410-Chlamydomonas_euryale.AAC.6
MCAHRPLQVRSARLRHSLRALQRSFTSVLARANLKPNHCQSARIRQNGGDRLALNRQTAHAAKETRHPEAYKKREKAQVAQGNRAQGVNLDPLPMLGLGFRV